VGLAIEQKCLLMGNFQIEYFTPSGLLDLGSISGMGYTHSCLFRPSRAVIVDYKLIRAKNFSPLRQRCYFHNLGVFSG
jgi:hypothetical protein